MVYVNKSHRNRGKKHPKPNKADCVHSGIFSSDRLAQLATPKFRRIIEAPEVSKAKNLNFKLSPRINEMALPKRAYQMSAPQAKPRQMSPTNRNYRPSKRLMQLAEPRSPEKKMLMKRSASCFNRKQPVERSQPYSGGRDDQRKIRKKKRTRKPKAVVPAYKPKDPLDIIEVEMRNRSPPEK